MWDNPTMSTTRVDSKKRIVLPNSKPGDVYEVQPQGEGRFLLVRLERPQAVAPMSREECLAAMENFPLSPTLTWEELRRITRDT